MSKQILNYQIIKRVFHTVFGPPLPESIQSGAITKWLKFPKEKVKRDELLAVFECDKGAIDINSPISGIVKQHLVKIDQEIKPGTAIMTIDDSIHKVKFSKENFGLIREKKKLIKLVDVTEN